MKEPRLEKSLIEPELPNNLSYCSSVPEALSEYIADLYEYDSLKAIEHAQKLTEYRDKYVIDRSFQAELRDLFNQLYTLIEDKYPKLRFLIEGRKKSLIKTEEKILQFFKENKSLDLIRDLMAFRVVIFGKDCPELIKQTYSVLELCLELCIRSGFTVCNADPISKDDFDEKKYKKIKPDDFIVVPQTSLVSPLFENSIKDYIRYPKSNGYQSLHVNLRNATDGRCFELQVRTLDMHIRSQVGEASHENHNKSRYSEKVDFDPSTILMEGFYASENKLLDYLGVIDSSQFFQRKKSF